MSEAPSLEELLSGAPKKKPAGAAASGVGGEKGSEGKGTAAEEEEENLDDVEETVMERLMGLTEMVPERVWSVTGRGLWFSVWLVRRSAWVLGTSLALLALPPFIESQRLEYEEMQNQQKKQLLLGQGAPTAYPPQLPR